VVLHTVWTLEDGKLVRFESFTDEQAALQAAERRERAVPKIHTE
jgi:ketosteroid isomerase-like protein